MQHIIRKATISDAPALSALARITFTDTYAAQNTADDLRLHLERTYTPEKQRSEIEDVTCLTLVAELNGVLTGFAQGKFSSPPACLASQTPAPRKPWEILRFYVHRDWHGRGIAQALMRETVARALEASADGVWLGVWSKNERARAYYLKAGFRQVGETTFTLGTDPQLDYVMYQPLAQPTRSLRDASTSALPGVCTAGTDQTG